MYNYTSIYFQVEKIIIIYKKPKYNGGVFKKLQNN